MPRVPVTRAEQFLRLEHAIAQRLAVSAAPHAAMNAALRAICETERWDVGELWLIDDARGVLQRYEAWMRPDLPAGQEFASRSSERLPAPGVGLLGAAWQSNHPLWIEDVSKDPRAEREALASETGLRGALLFPVRYGDRVVGVLSFACRAIRAPEGRLLQSLDVIGTQIGQFLQRAHAEAALRDSEARFRSLTELSSDWYWEQDAEYRFTRLEGHHVAGGDGTLYKRLIGSRRWESGLETEGGWEAHEALLRSRKPFHDIVMWRTLADGTVRYVSISGEPVFNSDGRFAGYRGVGREITAQKRAEQLLRLEHSVALSLAEAEDASSGLKAVIRAFCEAEGWACGRFFQVHESDGVLRMQESWNIPDPGLEQFVRNSKGLTFRPGEGLAGAVWQSGEPVWSPDTNSDPRVHARGVFAGTVIRGAFVFPVKWAGKTIGVLSFTSQSVREPDDRLRQAALVIASQIGQFLQRKQAEADLRESETRFRSLTQMSTDFFWETGPQHRFSQMVHGPNYVARFGKELGGKTPWELPFTAPDQAGWTRLRAAFEAHEAFRDFEFARPWPDGSTRHFTVSGEPRFTDDGRFLGYRGVGRDTTEIALAREHIASLAYNDTLTGLANRTSLGPAFDQAVERARRRGVKLAALFIDLDGFKPVNDRHGHTAGDRLLVEVARRLRANLRASDLVARLGGDEFFVVIEDVHDTGVLENIARKLLGEIQRPCDLGMGEEAHVSASMGISVFPDDAGDAANLMKHADTAMYAAKQAGRNGFRFFLAEPSPKAA